MSLLGYSSRMMMMMMMSDEQQLQDPSFQRQTGLLIHLNTCSPRGMAAGASQGTLAGVVVVVVVEATRASITKPQTQASPQEGVGGVTNSRQSRLPRGRVPQPRARAGAAAPGDSGALLLKLGLV